MPASPVRQDERTGEIERGRSASRPPTGIGTHCQLFSTSCHKIVLLPNDGYSRPPTLSSFNPNCSLAQILFLQGMMNSPSLLEDTRQKAVNNSLSDGTSDLILKATEFMQHLIDNNADPEVCSLLHDSVLHYLHSSASEEAHFLVGKGPPTWECAYSRPRLQTYGCIVQYDELDSK